MKNQTRNFGKFSSQKIIKLLHDNSSDIPIRRKILLHNSAIESVRILKEEGKINIVYLCTHNSRRSQLAQIWSSFLVQIFKLEKIYVHSAGSEKTTLSDFVILSMGKFGFSFKEINDDEKSAFNVFFNQDRICECYSKDLQDDSIPCESIYSIHTCAEAEQSCPFLKGSIGNFSLNYPDPKQYDSAENPTIHYQETALQIGTECFYFFNAIKDQLFQSNE